ncbi:MAG TPA: ATP-binding cassette domain-containing protein [Solirubrobacteraceae bacterium]|nr:ATP-binding cassette domain-containing protein [Solirubrobacteraceae bacterium]
MRRSTTNSGDADLRTPTGSPGRGAGRKPAGRTLGIRVGGKLRVTLPERDERDERARTRQSAVIEVSPRTPVQASPVQVPPARPAGAPAGRESGHLPDDRQRVVELRGVSMLYGAGDVGLERATFGVGRGELVFMVGPTGSGKSTIMRLLIKELEPTEGTVRVAGRNLADIARKRVPYYRRNIGVVFQDFKLLPNRTVYENVAYALQVTGASRKRIRSTLPDLLRLTGLSTKLHNHPHQLSGGEQQRVAVARAFASHPPLLLADEPTGNLDPETSIGIMQLLYRINRAGTTVLIATHDREMVDRMKRRVIELRRGRIVRDEATGLYAREESTGELGERLRDETLPPIREGGFGRGR